MPRSCVVPNCSTSRPRAPPFHVFPNPEKDPDRFKDWLTAIGGGILKMDALDIYHKQRICNAHFEEMFYVRNHRLSNIAVPTLHMPEKVYNIDIDLDGTQEQEQEQNSQEESLDCETQVVVEPQSACIAIKDHDYSTHNNDMENITVYVPEYVCPDQVAYEEIVKADDEEVIDNVTLEHLADDSWMEGSQEFDALRSPENVESQAGSTDDENASVCDDKDDIVCDNEDGIVCKVICDGRWKQGSDVPNSVQSPRIASGTDMSKERPQKKPIHKLTSIEFKLHMRLLRDINKVNRAPQLSKKRDISIKTARDITRNPQYLTLLETSDSRYRLKTMMHAKDQKAFDNEATKPHYSLQQKIVALAIFKHTPVAYNFLKQILPLPAVHVIQKLISHNAFTAASNPKTFKQLKNLVKNITVRERLCVLLYDEICLKVDIPLQVDVLNREAAFPEYVRERRSNNIDYGQVFIIRGLLKNYVQPVSYSFTEQPLTAKELSQKMKSVITELHKAGVIVVAFILDRNGVKWQALDILKHETRCSYIMKGKEPKRHVICINGREIVPLHDPPTLLRCIRNHLLTKDLKLSDSEDHGNIAKWKHIAMLYNEKPGFQGVSCVPDLTENHVMPEKIPLGDTKYASQVFSRTVGAYMGYLAETGILPQECIATANTILFFNKLFDSQNGTAHKKPRIEENPLLRAVTPVSKHHQVWNEARKQLVSMQFVDPTTGADIHVNALRDWASTLDSTEFLLEKLVEKYQITSICMGQLNQDPLDSYFALIKSEKCTDDNPLNDRFDDSTSLVVNRVARVYKVKSKEL